jgi:hypothetical protein
MEKIVMELLEMEMVEMEMDGTERTLRSDLLM